MSRDATLAASLPTELAVLGLLDRIGRRSIKCPSSPWPCRARPWRPRRRALGDHEARQAEPASVRWPQRCNWLAHATDARPPPAYHPREAQACEEHRPRRRLGHRKRRQGKRRVSYRRPVARALRIQIAHGRAIERPRGRRANPCPPSQRGQRSVLDHRAERSERAAEEEGLLPVEGKRHVRIGEVSIEQKRSVAVRRRQRQRSVPRRDKDLGTYRDVAFLRIDEVHLRAGEVERDVVTACAAAPPSPAPLPRRVCAASWSGSWSGLFRWSALVYGATVGREPSICRGPPRPRQRA